VRKFEFLCIDIGIGDGKVLRTGSKETFLRIRQGRVSSGFFGANFIIS
jgi:hypothetical protein